ncbi:MAG TPA: hypothetical protein VGK64_28460 [Bryobacteraceae bacterium]
MVDVAARAIGLSAREAYPIYEQTGSKTFRIGAGKFDDFLGGAADGGLGIGKVFLTQQAGAENTSRHAALTDFFYEAPWADCVAGGLVRQRLGLIRKQGA